MATSRLSDRQQRILKYIEYSFEHRGYPPSIREIGDNVGISSTSVVDYNLRILESAGKIWRDRDVSRGIALLQNGAGHGKSSSLRIPVVGRIAAGAPIEAVEDVSQIIELPAGTVPHDAFALRVSGTSMIDDHIEDGDVIIVKPQPTVETGEIAVVVISGSDGHDGATVKRLHHEGQNVRLQPRNSAMQPFTVPAAQVHVRGKVIKLLRDL